MTRLRPRIRISVFGGRITKQKMETDMELG